MTREDGQEVRPDWEWLCAARRERRGLDRLAVHYELERDLATKLREAPVQERMQLYGDVYDQLFAALPDHPQWTIEPGTRAQRARHQISLLSPMLDRSMTVVEIGCGDAATSFTLAPMVAEVVGVDVTERLVGNDRPPNFRFVRTDGLHLDLADNSVDLVFSNQLIEHLHVEDADAQLREILRILKPGGRYVCMTPNRLMGPNDISVYFSYTPQGLHMKEYDHRSLAETMRAVGYRAFSAIGTVKGRRYELPIWAIGAIERSLATLPRSALFWIYRRLTFLYNMSLVTVCGTK